MANEAGIHEGMEVLGSDGGMIGRVDRAEGDRVLLQPTSQLSGAHRHAFPLAWVARADDHVHLDRTAALAREEWELLTDADVGATTPSAAAGATHVSVSDGDRDGAPHLSATEARGAAPADSHELGAAGGVRGAGKGGALFPWLAGIGSVLLAVGMGINAYQNRQENDVGSYSKAEGARTVAATPMRAGPLPAVMQQYLAGTGTEQGVFALEPHFDTNSATIKPDYAPGLAEVGRQLAARPNARVRVVGYADARGGAGTNANLGIERARAVAAALTAAGLPAARVETASGGEAEPQATNATAPGQLSNRRAELIVLSR